MNIILLVDHMFGDIGLVCNYFFVERLARERAGLLLFPYGEFGEFLLPALAFVVQNRLFNGQTFQFSDFRLHDISCLTFLLYHIVFVLSLLEI